MATEAAKQVVLELCGELLGRSPGRWDAERLEELAQRVDRAYRNQPQGVSPPAARRNPDPPPEKAA